MEALFMKAKTISVTYEPGEYNLTQGHKGYEKKRYKNNRYINPTGFGWATEYKPSRIIVGVDVKGLYAEVWVDRFFKDNWGKLTTKRVKAIKATLPDKIKVHECETYYGSTYYVADEKSLEDWLKAARAVK